MLLPLSTLIAAVVIAVLVGTLHYAQRVMPFSSTRLLLLAVVLSFAAFLARLVVDGSLLEMQSHALLVSALAWVRTTFFFSSCFLIAFVFRADPKSPTHTPLLETRV